MLSLLFPKREEDERLSVKEHGSDRSWSGASELMGGERLREAHFSSELLWTRVRNIQVRDCGPV